MESNAAQVAIDRQIFQKEVDILRGVCDIRATQAADLTQQNAKLKKKCARLEEKMRNSNEIIERLEEQVEGLSATVEGLRRQSRESQGGLRNRLQGLEGLVEDLEDSKANLTAKLSEKTRELITLRGVLEKKEAEINQLLQSAQQEANKRDRLKRTIGIKTVQVARLEGHERRLV